MKRGVLSLIVALLVISGCSEGLKSEEGVAAESRSVVVKGAQPLLYVDGKQVGIQAFNIDGYNYFKLRDMAMALKGSPKEIGIQYNAQGNVIQIFTDRTYDPVGGELVLSKTGVPGQVIPSASRLLVDGQTAGISAYNIDGYNYFKLRDLGQSMNFGIDWDEEKSRISIDTAKPYQVIQLEESFGASAYAHVVYFQEHLSNRLSGTQKEREAAAYILADLKKAGYTNSQIREQPFTFVKADGLTYRSTNIIVTHPGQKDSVVVVGAHYDSINSHGADDNGSGVGLLLETAARMVDETLPYTVQFVFFGAEENGIFGSPAFVNSLTPEEKKDILLMVNLDSIMAGDRPYIIGGDYQQTGGVADTWPAERAKRTADELGLTMFLDTELEPRHLLLMSDQGPFREAGIPYVFFLAGNLDYYPEDPYRQTVKLGVIMNSTQDDLALLNQAFPGRAEDRLSAYSQLLYHFILELEAE